MFLKNMMDYIWEGGKQSRSVESRLNSQNQHSVNFLNLPKSRPPFERNVNKVNNGGGFFNFMKK